MTEPSVDVLVLGAGVIGLTAAVALAESGHRVTVWTADPLEATTSRVAGAIWKPYLSGGADVAAWAETTLRVLSEHAGIAGSGVRLLPLLESTTAPADLPDWAVIASARPLRADELPSGWAGGFRCVVPVVDTGLYLPYLATRLAAAGGTLLAGHRVGALTDVGTWPVVVNCTGLGARELTGDSSLVPIRGQVVVLTNPGIDYCVGDTGPQPDAGTLADGGRHPEPGPPADTYVIAHQDTVVVGGTADRGRWSLDVDPVAAEAMVDRARLLVPELAGASVVRHRVGLRPYRPTVRLAVDPSPPAGISLLIHDYGHGGSGVTLSWGCALAVRRLVSAAGRTDRAAAGDAPGPAVGDD